MIKKIVLSTSLGFLAYGFWISPDFKEICAGVAIFLFGMISLEEGFKTFTGGILESILRRTTDNKWKSLSFGIVSTTLMQSSSLVSVITISFLSAGLISLSAGIGIIFGANLGTTTGAWLIAGLGMKVKISAYAMPMLVFGVIGIFQKSRSLNGIGYVLAGLGFLFLGIHHMKEGFEAFRDTIDLMRFAVDGYLGILLFTLLGMAATVIMQSSHATLVLIISALAANQIHYDNALALAIGANIGTTITAILGSISANVEGKRLAAAHLVFNVITAAIAIAFLHQIAISVDWVSSIVGIGADNYTLKLAVFHTIFNSIGIIVMFPFIERLAGGLNRYMPSRADERERPMYLSQAAEELPDTAIEAVRKETLRLYDNAFAIIAHGLSLHRDEILSTKDLRDVVATSATPMPIDIDAEYDSTVKELYGAIVLFISRSQTSMQPDQVDELFNLRAAGRDIVEATKEVKHLHKNLTEYISSDNKHIRAEYNKIRFQLATLMRSLAIVREEGHDPLAIMSLDDLKYDMEKNDVTVNGALETLIRNEQITPAMATSLMNDSTYAHKVAMNLLQMAEALFATGDQELKLAERSIGLSRQEVREILEQNNPHQDDPSL